VDLSACQSAEEVAALVAERQGRCRRPWIRGRAGTRTAFPGGAFPDRRALDAAVPAHPALLERVDGHAALVNAAALARAGLSRGSGGDPPGGQILRDEQGEPTGVLVDAAMELVARCVPPPSAAELEQLLAEAARRCAAAGLVGVHERGRRPGRHRGAARLDERGELPLRSTPWPGGAARACAECCRPVRRAGPGRSRRSSSSSTRPGLARPALFQE
jgi:predicted amidohydrolase YtcJ